jgi:aminoglycoside phosphotransferase (APT) family kinase protein
VPEPVGVVPEFRMWLQRRVRGVTVGALLAGPDGVALARRVAAAIRKVHHAGVPATRHHAMADELRILHECLPRVSALRPEFAARIARLLAACDRLAAGVPVPHPCGIHRDFYPAQVIVDGARLWLLDFDLYCAGDPGLDAGNFIAHVTEESLRLRGDAGALRGVESVLEEHFVELAGPTVRPAVRAYTTLTLARHVYLSTQFPQRSAFTGALLNLCEQRLA